MSQLRRQRSLGCLVGVALMACLSQVVPVARASGQPPLLPVQSPSTLFNRATSPVGPVDNGGDDDGPVTIRQVYVPESRLVEFMQGRPAYLPLSAEKFREILAGNASRGRTLCRGEPVRHWLTTGPGGSLQGQSLVRLRAAAPGGAPLATLPSGPAWVEFDQWTVPAEFFNLVPQLSAAREAPRETARELSSPWASSFPPSVAWQEVPVTLSVNEQGSFGLPLSQASEWMLVRYNLALATQADASGRRQIRLPNCPTTLTTVQTSDSAPTSFYLNGPGVALQSAFTAAEIADVENRSSRRQYFCDGPEVIGQFIEFDAPVRSSLLHGRYAERSTLTIERALQRFEGVVDLEFRQAYWGEIVLELPVGLHVTRCEVNGVPQLCEVRNLDLAVRQWVLPWQNWSARHEIRVAGVLNAEAPERIVIPRLRLPGQTWMSGAVQVGIAAPLSLVDYELIDGRVLRSQALGRVQDLSFQWGSPDSLITLLLDVPRLGTTIAASPGSDFTRLTAEPEKLEADQYLFLDDRFRDSNVITWEVADGWQVEQVAAFDTALLDDNPDQPLPESGLTPLNWSLIWENDRPRLSVVLPTESRESRLGLRLRAIQPVSQWPVEVEGRVVRETSPGRPSQRPCLVQVVSSAGIRPSPNNPRVWSGLSTEQARQRLPELRGLIGAGNLRQSDGPARLLLENAAGQSGGYDVLAHTFNRMQANWVVEQGHRFLIQPSGPVEEVRLSGGGDTTAARRWQVLNRTGQPLEHEVGPDDEGLGWSIRFPRPVNDSFVILVQQEWIAARHGQVPLYQFPRARQFQGVVDNSSAGPLTLQIRGVSPLVNPAADLRQFRDESRRWWNSDPSRVNPAATASPSPSVAASPSPSPSPSPTVSPSVAASLGNVDNRGTTTGVGPTVGRGSTLPDRVVAADPFTQIGPATATGYFSRWYQPAQDLEYDCVPRLEWASPTVLVARQIDTWQQGGWQTDLWLEIHSDTATTLQVDLPPNAVCDRVLINQDLVPTVQSPGPPRLAFVGQGRQTAHLTWNTPHPWSLVAWSGWERLPTAHSLLLASVAAEREVLLPPERLPNSSPSPTDAATDSLGLRVLSPLVWPRSHGRTRLAATPFGWRLADGQTSSYRRWQWTGAWPATEDLAEPNFLSVIQNSADPTRLGGNAGVASRLTPSSADSGDLDPESGPLQSPPSADARAVPSAAQWVFSPLAAQRSQWAALLVGCSLGLVLHRRSVEKRPATARGLSVAIIGGLALSLLLPWPWHEWVATVWLGVLLGDAWRRLYHWGRGSRVAPFDRRPGEVSPRSVSRRHLLTPTGAAWLLGIGCWGSQICAAPRWSEPTATQDGAPASENQLYPLVVIPVDPEQRPIGPVVYVPPALYQRLNQSPQVDRDSFDLERRGAQHTLEYDAQLRRFSRLTSLYTCKAATAKSYLLPSPVGPEHAIRQVRLNGVPVLFQRLSDGISVQMDVGTNLLSITYDLQLTQSRLQLDQHGLIDSYVVLSGVPNGWQAIVTDSRYPQTRFSSPIQRRFRTDRFRRTRVEVLPEAESWSNPTIETWLTFDPLQVRCETRLRLGRATGLRSELWFQVDPRMSLPAGYQAEAATWAVQLLPEDQRPADAVSGPVYRLQWTDNHNPEQIVRIPWEYQGQSFGRMIAPSWRLLDPELPLFRRLLVVQVDSNLVYRTLELSNSHFRRGSELELMSSTLAATDAVGNLPSGAASEPATGDRGGQDASQQPVDLAAPTGSTASNLFVYEQMAEPTNPVRSVVGRLSLQPTQVIGSLNQEIVLAADTATLSVRGELEVTHGELSQWVFQLPQGGKLQRLALLSAQQNEVAWVGAGRGSESDVRAAFLRTPLQGAVRVELDVELPLPSDDSIPLPWVQLPGFPEVSHSVQLQNPENAWLWSSEAEGLAVVVDSAAATSSPTLTPVRVSESAERLRALRLQRNRNAADLTGVPIANEAPNPPAPADASRASPTENATSGRVGDSDGPPPATREAQPTGSGTLQPEIVAGRFVLAARIDDRQHLQSSALTAALSGIDRLTRDAAVQAPTVAQDHAAAEATAGTTIAGWQQLVIRNRGLDRLTLVVPVGWVVRRAWLDGAPVLATALVEAQSAPADGETADVAATVAANTKVGFAANPLGSSAAGEVRQASVAVDPLQEYSLLTLELVGRLTPAEPRLAWVSQGTPIALHCETDFPEGWPADLPIEAAASLLAQTGLGNAQDWFLRHTFPAEGPAWGASLPLGHSMTAILQRPWPELPISQELMGTALSLASQVPLPQARIPTTVSLTRRLGGIALLGLALWLAVRGKASLPTAWRWPGRPGTSPFGGDLLWLGLSSAVWLAGGPGSLAILFAAVGCGFLLQRAAQLGFLRRFA